MLYIQKIFRFCLALTFGYTIPACAELSKEAREKGFMYLHEIDPSIIVSPRYHSGENFTGTQVRGYNKNVIVLHEKAAQALKKVQETVKKDGYSLVVYDGYRPQQAVDSFIEWADNIQDQKKKADYYPDINKADVFELGYVAKKSGHSRGSTVDLTLIKLGQQIQPIKAEDRKLLDGSSVKYLNDGTVDMGTSFDLFGKASHHENTLVEEQYKKLRTYLKDVMFAHGFKTIDEEWWHFTLKNEPYPADQASSYFNFPIE